MPQHKLKQAAASDKLRPFLSHSKLRAIIKQIDSSRYRKKSYWRQVERDTDFKAFADLLLQEMGYLNDKGQFEAE